MNFNTRMILTIFITIYFVNKLTKKLLIIQIKNEVETEKKSDVEAKKKNQTGKKIEVENEKNSESNEVIKNKEINDFKKKINKIIKKQKNEYPDYSSNINQFFLQKTIK
jgi:hypothetical protein